MVTFTNPLTPKDYFTLKCPGDPQLSPDGSQVVYGVETKHLEANKVSTDLWCFDVGNDSDPRRLTLGDHQDTQPRWSPDGRHIAFISNRTGRNQIWIMPVDGGEPQHLFTEETPIGPLVFSPDGRSIAYTARTFSVKENGQPYPGAPAEDRNRASKRAKKQEGDAGEGAFDVQVITRLRYRFDGKGFLGDEREQVYVMGTDAQKTAGSRQLTKGDYDHTGPVNWHPGGRFLTFAAVRRADADRTREVDLWQVEVANGALTRLMCGRGSVSHPQWAPRGDALAFIGHDSPHGPSSTPRLWLLPVDKMGTGDSDHADAVLLTASLDRPVGLGGIASDVRLSPSGAPFAWDAEGDGLYFLAADAGATSLYWVSRTGEIKEQYGKPDHFISGFSGPSDGIFVYQQGTSDRPEEIWLKANQKPPTPITRVNDEWLEDHWRTPAERFQYRSHDDWVIEGFIYKPRGFHEGQSYPTVLHVHGGPHASYGQAFLFKCQLLASRGYLVMLTNPRGSQTYGSEFAAAVVEDWGGDDYLDIMHGIEWGIEQGWVDPTRMGVTGWSYGGFMSAWIMSQTDRFTAGIVGAPVSNRHSFYGTSDIGYDFGEHQTGATPWSMPERLLERSPLSYADRIQTPVLLMHGANDLRCPVAQSEELYVALKRLNREAALVMYPGESHAIKKPKHQLDQFDRTLAWFDYHLDAD